MEEKIKEAAKEYSENYRYDSLLTSTGFRTKQLALDAFEAGAKWQQQSSVDLEEVREKYNELIEDGENQEEEEFFPNIWNLFAPLIKGSDAVELPTDSESEKWFEENIGIVNNCSASSAIYKFRLWLRERK